MLMKLEGCSILRGPGEWNLVSFIITELPVMPFSETNNPPRSRYRGSREGLCCRGSEQITQNDKNKLEPS
jgi:hypothetical protein